MFRQVVSLGPTCRGKHQTQRLFGWRAGPRLVFDWQVTPASTIVAYLRRDFRGFFARRDLEAVEGVVRNRRFGTSHQHEFPRGATKADLDATYRRARRLHDRWCRRMRKAIRSRSPTLFVFGAPMPQAVLGEIDALIRKRRWWPYRILPAPFGDTDRRWTGDDAAWSRHLAPFFVEPTLRATIAYRLHKAIGNIRRRFGLAEPGVEEEPANLVL